VIDERLFHSTNFTRWLFTSLCPTVAAATAGASPHEEAVLTFVMIQGQVQLFVLRRPFSYLKSVPLVIRSFIRAEPIRRQPLLALNLHYLLLPF